MHRQIGPAGLVRDGGASRVIGRRHPWRDGSKLKKIAAVQWQSNNIALFHNLADRRRFALQRRCGSHDFDALAHIADLQTHLDAPGLIDKKIDVANIGRFEPAGGNLNVVPPWGELWYGEKPSK